MKSITLAFITVISCLYLRCDTRKTITLQKSSDSEWEISAVCMPDTTITDTVRIGGVEAHRTIQYLNVTI